MSNFDLRNNKLPAQDDGATRVLFMGTGFFALPLLEVLIATPGMHVVGVVTKPDAKVGRGNKRDRALHENPIKEATLNQGIHLSQPAQLDEEFIVQCKQLRPTVIIVVSYGKILPKALLEVSEHGAINVHASLLPKFRGASPIQNALLLGEKETGVSIMQMDAGLDTGPVYVQSKLPISPKDLAPRLTDLLATLGANTLIKVLPDILSDKMKPTPQDDTKATLCQIINREDGRVSWLTSSADIFNKYKALTPWPGLFTYWHKSATESQRIKINAVALYDGALDLSKLSPGSVFVDEKVLCIRTADSAIVILNLQREGKSTQDATSFLNGNPEFANAKLI